MNEEKRRSAADILLALLKAGAYLLLFLGIQTLVTAAFVLIAAISALVLGSGIGHIDLFVDQVMGYTGAISLISSVLTLLVLLAVFLIRKKNPLAEVGLVATRPCTAAAAAAVTPALYVLVIVVMGFLPQQWLEDYAQASAGLNDTGLLSFLATVIAAPLAEEVIFRGLVQSRLARAMPGWLAAVISALVFGLCHGQAVWVAYAFALGLIFSRMRLRSGSILPSLLAHVVFNAIGHFAVVLEDRVFTWAILAGLLAISAVGCLLARRGLAALFGKGDPQQEVPPDAT